MNYEEILVNNIASHKAELEHLKDRFLNRVTHDIDFNGFERSAIADLTELAELKSRIQAMELDLILLRASKEKTR